VEEGLALVAWLSIEFILVYTGKGLITAISLGRWRGERISKNEGRIYSAAGALSFIREGRRVITTNGLLFAGLIFYVTLAVLLVYATTR
jgi:hypothetical protein